MSLPQSYYVGLADHPEIGNTALEALHGDTLAILAFRDWLEEQGETVEIPFKVGKSYLVCTVTLYYVGRVESVDLAWMILRDASWVHWTGRLSVLLARQSFTHKDLSSRKPRVEPCGRDKDDQKQEAIISMGSIVSAYPWSGELPKEPVQ
jgi:hypothetical protein